MARKKVHEKSSQKFINKSSTKKVHEKVHQKWF